MEKATDTKNKQAKHYWNLKKENLKKLDAKF